MEKVLVVIITDRDVLPECWQAVVAQDYPNYDVLVHVRKPKVPADSTSMVSKYLNCTDNREAARKLALASDADRFLFVDSDVVLPIDAITELMKQRFDVQGGWYKVRNEQRYTCGRWVADNLFINLNQVEPSLVRVDCIGMGCAMFTRRVLKKITFAHGTDMVSNSVIGGQQVKMILGECAVLGNLLAKRGVQQYMNGSVVCEHLAA